MNANNILKIQFSNQLDKLIENLCQQCEFSCDKILELQNRNRDKSLNNLHMKILALLDSLQDQDQLGYINALSKCITNDTNLETIKSPFANLRSALQLGLDIDRLTLKDQYSTNILSFKPKERAYFIEYAQKQLEKKYQNLINNFRSQHSSILKQSNAKQRKNGLQIGLKRNFILKPGISRTHEAHSTLNTAFISDQKANRSSVSKDTRSSITFNNDHNQSSFNRVNTEPTPNKENDTGAKEKTLLTSYDRLKRISQIYGTSKSNRISIVNDPRKAKLIINSTKDLKNKNLTTNK